MANTFSVKNTLSQATFISVEQPTINQNMSKQGLAYLSIHHPTTFKGTLHSVCHVGLWNTKPKDCSLKLCLRLSFTGFCFVHFVEWTFKLFFKMKVHFVFTVGHSLKDDGLLYYLRNINYSWVHVRCYWLNDLRFVTVQFVCFGCTDLWFDVFPTLCIASLYICSI